MLTFIDSLFQRENSSAANTYKNYQSKDHYYHNLMREDRLFRFIYVFERQKEAEVNPDLKIQFRDMPFGLSQKEILMRMGKPRYEIDNDHQIPTHKVIFYRSGLGHFRAISQLHFIENQFFYAKYSFRYYESRNHDSILNVLRQKYFNTQHFADKISTVRDANHNAILLEKSLHLNVAYLSGNPFFLHYISELEQSKRQAEEAKQNRKLKALEDYL